MATERNGTNLKPKQYYIFLGILALLGIALLVAGNFDSSGRQSGITDTVPKETSITAASPSARAAGTNMGTDTVTAMEQKLAYTLSQIQDAGTVTVQISVKSMGRKEYATDTQHTSRTTAEENGDSSQQTVEVQEQQTVVQQNQNGTQGALLVEETVPEITGVLVVAGGAQNAAVQERLLHAAATLLQIPVHQVMVVPGEEA